MKANLLLFVSVMLSILYVESKSKDSKDSKDKKKNKKEREKVKKYTSFKEEPNNVLEITKENTDIVKKDSNGRFLVLFYEDYSKKSQKWNSLLNQLSMTKGKGLEGVKFIRSNTRKVKEFANEHGGYLDNPVLYLICNDIEVSFSYEGKPDAEKVINFIHKIIKVKISEIKSLEDLHKIKQKGSNIVLVGDVNKFKNAFNTIAKYAKKYFKNSYWTSNEYFYKKFNIKPNEMDAIAFFTQNGTLNEGERMNFSVDEINKEKILKISEIYSRKPYTHATHQKLEKLIENRLRGVFVIHKEGVNATEKEKIDSVMRDLSMKFREDYWFLKVDSGHQISDILLDSFVLDDEKHLPALGIVDNKKSTGIDLDCYVFDYHKELTRENIEKFIIDHKNGNLKRSLISEIEHEEVHNNDFNGTTNEENLTNDPTNNSTDSNRTEQPVPKDYVYIKVVVGKTVEKLIFNNTGKDVVLFICSESKHCSEYFTRFNRIVDRLTGNSKTIFTAQINHVMNEIPGVNFTHIPALVVVPDIASNTGKNWYLFDGKDFTSKKVLEFIKKHVIHPLNLTATPYEKRENKEEKEKKTKYITRQKDEDKQDDATGYISGNGFIRAVHRYINDFYENKAELDAEERSHSDHDAEDYDNDPDEQHQQQHYVHEDL